MLNDINKIEQLFSENLASPSYIVLATYYYQQRLFDYAQKVCEIGLKHDSDNIDGNYMMAKLLLVKNETSQAEQLLKKILYKECVFAFGDIVAKRNETCGEAERRKKHKRSSNDTSSEWLSDTCDSN